MRGNLQRSFWGPRFIRNRQSDTTSPTDPDDLIPPTGTIILVEDGFVLREDNFILVEPINA